MGNDKEFAGKWQVKATAAEGEDLENKVEKIRKLEEKIINI